MVLVSFMCESPSKMAKNDVCFFGILDCFSLDFIQNLHMIIFQNSPMYEIGRLYVSSSFIFILIDGGDISWQNHFELFYWTKVSNGMQLLSYRGVPNENYSDKFTVFQYFLSRISSHIQISRIILQSIYRTEFSILNIGEETANAKELWFLLDN